MILNVYKGFDKKFLSEIKGKPLINNLENKFDYMIYNDDYKDDIEESLILNRREVECWIIYEEFELAYTFISERAESKKIIINIIKNNIYPELYPVQLNIDKDLYEEYLEYINTTNIKKLNPKILDLVKLYSNIEIHEGKTYVNYYNYEIPNNYKIENIIDYYSSNIEIKKTDSITDYIVDIGNDMFKYLIHVDEIVSKKYETISYKMFCDTEISNMILNSLKSLLKLKGYETLYKFEGEYVVNNYIKEELISVATDILKIKDFNFRLLDFYKRPEISNEMEKISQAEIMEAIITQCEKAYNGERYRDIFITAPTGSGKSLIFQLPAIYLSEKYKKLILIIEPLKGLQLDQQKNLDKAGYSKSAYLNSDIATIVEREKILNDVKNGIVNILYVSPETLLSHSIESLIGDRSLGLVIVDEAHIVTTWGVGFRPDYWYLGSYLNKMRTKKDKSGKEKKYYDFPIFACTATAVNGGLDDTVSDTVVSLYMNDPIIKIGSPKRKNIHFNINNYSDKTYDEYKVKKIDVLKSRLNEWINCNKKSIVYCPYSTIAHNMKQGTKDFFRLSNLKKQTCVYTGSNENPEEKQEAMEKFKSGDINIMYATKAFGMGIDIPDITNVYHYAVTGGLSDYVQEIGRAARDKNMTGYAVIDYFNGDMKYMNNLFGMSQIKQYHVKRCLSIIYDVYISKNYKANFLINPKMFDGIFGILDDDQLVNKVKIVLLMLEKDLYEKYKNQVLISRPSSIFTKCYVAIDKTKEHEIISSKIGTYLKKICSGRNKEGASNGIKYSDIGDIFEFDLKTLWENEFGSKMSFASFKYKFYSSPNEIIGTYSKFIFNRVKLKVRGKNCKLNELFEKAKNEIDYLTDTLDEFGREYFTKDEFKNKIITRYVRESKADIIANSYFDLIDSDLSCVKRRENNDIVKYQISNGNLRSLGLRTLKQSSLLRDFSKDIDEYEKYYSENKSDSNILRLLSIFDLITFEIEGGKNPEIFIRLNAPDKIKNIVDDKILYKNHYVEIAKEKHYRSVKILDYFFKHFEKDDFENRWNFIERYFLGEDIASEINEKNPIIIKKINIDNYIDIKNFNKLDDYTNWDNIIADYFFNRGKTKYIYYCKLLNKNDIKIPNYVFTTCLIKNLDIDSIFIYTNNNVLIVDEMFNFQKEQACLELGWNVFRIESLENELENLKKILNN